MRNHALDGLRACAATLIVAYHLGLTAMLAIAAGGGAHVSTLMKSLGSSGVDLFFTLSAVVLLQPYLARARPMEVRVYFWRRLKRLWPPFLGAWLLAGVAVAIVTAYPTWWPSAMPTFDWSVWGSQAFIAYLGMDAYNFAWWTLTIELMFYAIAPLLVAVMAGRSPRTTRVLFLVSIVLAQASFLVSSESLPIFWGLRFLSFASCFVGGMVLASHGMLGRGTGPALAAGVAIVAASVIERRVDAHIGFGLIYMAVVSLALDARSRVHEWLSRPGFVWLGERSYSLFLTHFSVIALACWSTSLMFHAKTAEYFVVSRGLAVAGALLVSCVLFECVESRFANGLVTVGQWWPGKRGLRWYKATKKA